MNLSLKNITKSPLYDGLFFRFWCFGGGIFITFQFLRILTLFLIGWDFNWDDFLKIILGGIKMDISTTSYLLGYLGTIIGLIRISIIKSAKRFLKLIIALNTIVFIVLISVVIADIFLLKYWGSRINSQALAYLKFPIQALKSSLSEGIFISVIIGLILLVLGIYIWSLRISKELHKFLSKSKLSIKSGVYLLITIAIIVLGARGGWSKVPLQISEAFEFQNQNNLNNQLSLNSIWNFIHQILNEDQHPDIEYITQQNWPDYSDPFEVNTQENIPKNKEKNSNHKVEFSHPIFAENSKPNVYLFILEGVSAEVSGYFSNSKTNATPKIDELASAGWGFKQAFACGDRTDKGLATILTGWPGQPWQSILNYPEKYRKLPSIVKTLSRAGYKSNFYYGGNSQFANMKDFLLSIGVENIIDEREIDKMELSFVKKQSSICFKTWQHFNRNISRNNLNNLQRFASKNSHRVTQESQKAMSEINLGGNWGYYDPLLFDVLMQHANKIKRSKQPSFNIVLTSSTHEPYDINEQFIKKGSDKSKNLTSNPDIEKYIQAVRILDESIYQCIKSILTVDKNALFVIVSDHGKYLNDANTMYGQRNFFHIPLIFYSNSINKMNSHSTRYVSWDDKSYGTNQVVSQTDVAKSLEYLILNNNKSFPRQEFQYSSNVFDKKHLPKAWFTMYGVMGIVEPNETNWLSTDKKALESELPWNSKDSAIIHRGRRIILDFFSL